MIDKFNEKLERLINNNKSFILFSESYNSSIQLWENDINSSGNNIFVCKSFDNLQSYVFLDDNVIKINSKKFSFENNLKLNIDNNLYVETSYKKYINDILYIKDIIKNSKLEKLVLSRVKKINIDNINIWRFFKKLVINNIDKYVYLFYDSNKKCLWIGASPEMLIKKYKNIVKSISLAGTKLIKEIWTYKEYLEQRIVTDYIYNIFKCYFNNVIINGPYEVKVFNYKHLKSYIQGNINYNFNNEKILSKLHPTPAISGYPKNLSLKYINIIEDHNRDLYCGYMGYKNHNGNFNYFVNLRCVNIYLNKLYIFVGGGILSSSVPEKEWDETEIKSQSLLNYIFYL